MLLTRKGGSPPFARGPRGEEGGGRAVRSSALDVVEEGAPGEPGDHGADDRRDPEEPELRQRPATDEEGGSGHHDLADERGGERDPEEADPDVRDLTKSASVTTVRQGDIVTYPLG